MVEMTLGGWLRFLASLEMTGSVEMTSKWYWIPAFAGMTAGNEFWIALE
jgi:hypothetical protein